MTEPLLVVCVDGGDARLVDRLVAAGRVPFLARLIGRGARVEIETTADALPECLWGPVLAGRPPGDHALAHFLEFDAATQGLRLRRESVLEPLWLHVGERGRGCLAFDVPECHPHPASQADEVCGWSEMSAPHRPLYTRPALRSAVRPGGRPTRLGDPDPGADAAAERRLSADLVANQGRRARAVSGLLPERRVACVGVHETHALVHGLGHHAGLEPHWHAPAAPEPELVEAPYAALDGFLRDVTARVPQANVAVLLFRGIRPANHASSLLEGLLERAGLLARAGAGSETDGGVVALTERLRRLVPEHTRERLATALLPTTAQTRLASAAFRDRYAWHRTVAFPLPSWDSGLIRLNLAGREAAGIVLHEDRNELLVRLRRLLRETYNADTGRPLIAGIHSRADFPGCRSDVLPDLLVTWAGDRPATRATHRELGTWKTEPQPVRWSEHRAQSTALLAGPDVRDCPEVLLGEPEDVAPTLLALCGVRRPSIMVGHAWTDVLA